MTLEILFNLLNNIFIIQTEILYVVNELKDIFGLLDFLVIGFVNLWGNQIFYLLFHLSDFHICIVQQRIQQEIRSF